MKGEVSGAEKLESANATYLGDRSRSREALETSQASRVSECIALNRVLHNCFGDRGEYKPLRTHAPPHSPLQPQRPNGHGRSATAWEKQKSIPTALGEALSRMKARHRASRVAVDGVVIRRYEERELEIDDGLQCLRMGWAAHKIMPGRWHPRLLVQLPDWYRPLRHMYLTTASTSHGDGCNFRPEPSTARGSHQTLAAVARGYTNSPQSYKNNGPLLGLPLRRHFLPHCSLFHGAQRADWHPKPTRGHIV